MQRYLINFLALLLGAYFQSSFALEADHNEKIFLSSATAQFNLNTKIGLYTGNVILKQGTALLVSDKLTTYADPQNHLERAIAIGHPAKYSVLLETNKPEFHAEADMIEFYPKENRVALVGNAKAYQENNVYAGPRIDYYINRQVVISPLLPQGRTNIILQQKKAQ